MKKKLIFFIINIINIMSCINCEFANIAFICKCIPLEKSDTENIKSVLDIPKEKYPKFHEPITILCAIPEENYPIIYLGKDLYKNLVCFKGHEVEIMKDADGKYYVVHTKEGYENCINDKRNNMIVMNENNLKAKYLTYYDAGRLLLQDEMFEKQYPLKTMIFDDKINKLLSGTNIYNLKKMFSFLKYPLLFGTVFYFYRKYK